MSKIGIGDSARFYYKICLHECIDITYEINEFDRQWNFKRKCITLHFD